MTDRDIVVLGYACRVPGASDVAALWKLVAEGRDVVTRAATNVGATAGGRVHAYGLVEGTELFDEDFFGYSPKEAAEIDPQQRLLLLCAVEALEAAGLRPFALDYDIGVWASTGLSSYLLQTWDPALSGTEGMSALMGGDPHYAATRIAYKLGLTGPAISVGSACSSSLLAIHSASQAIRAGECDLALAGGMDIEHPQPMSYLHQEGGILAADGVCRPFDRDATGSVFGSGGGLVLLADRSLAEREGWPVRAVLLGSAANNDGAAKASFTAPKSSRQADVIRQALAAGGVEPREVTYVECHGTGTRLGDRSELDAMAAVYGPESRVTLGSLKANLGHLRVGAGVVGFIKACEMLRHRTLPPIANLHHPSPAADEAGFVVPAEAAPMTDPDAAVIGVSSFGFGGTNVHAVVGAAPDAVVGLAADAETAENTDPVVLQVSAATPDSCLATSVRLADHLRTEPGIPLSAVARTLRQGREPKPYRLAVVARERQAAVSGLEGDAAFSVEGWASATVTPVVLVPGQGSDLAPLARALWEWEPVFTDTLRRHWSRLAERRPGTPGIETALGDQGRLTCGQRHAWYTAVVLAVIEQLCRRGLPDGLYAGYSLGEYAAAVAAGALDADSALDLLIDRGEALDRSAPAGLMLVVQAGPEQAARALPDMVPAAVFSERRTAFAVAAEAADDLRDRLTAAGLVHREADVDLPYHSPLLGESAAAFAALARSAAPRKTNRWIPTLGGGDDQEPSSYWERHLVQSVDLRAVTRSVDDLAKDARPALVDLSPDGFLGHTAGAGTAEVVTVHPGRSGADPRTAYLRALAGLWTAGIELDLSRPGEATTTVALPSRAWDLRPHRKERPQGSESVAVRKGTRSVVRERSVDRWMYHPSWRLRRRSPQPEDLAGQRWLVFAGRDGFSDRVVTELRALGVECVCLRPFDDVVPGDEESIGAALAGMDLRSRPVQRILHLWCAEGMTDSGDLEGRLTTLDTELAHGFYTLLFGFQALASQQGAAPVRLDIVAHGVHPLDSSGTASSPERALLAGPTLVIPQDLPFVTARSIDISALSKGTATPETVAELCAPTTEQAVALTPGGRWVRAYERDILPEVPAAKLPLRLREGGVYLITGGLGGIGMTLAEYLVRTCRARLVLTGLDAVPPTGPGAVLPDDDPGLAERAERIRKLKALGGEVLAVRCDAADREETAALFQEIDRRFGRLDGVVHAAGVFETRRAFRSLAETGREDCERRLRPKVLGTLMLAEFLRGRRLDFVLMQSSLSSHLGGLGFYAYTAGNAYMDAFAERHRDDDIPWMTVNWDGWIFREREDDAPHESVVSPSFASPDFGVVAEIAIRPSEGADIYGRLMNLITPHQVLVSTADFEARIDQWVRGVQPVPSTEPASVPADVALADPVAAQVARAWAELLGVGDLNPDSNFFAIGGDSLLGVSLAHRLSQEFDTVLSAITLFENPTITQMAKEIIRATAHSQEQRGEA
ncbi:SDR family NAD(P)-dependent oxidoreductase [Sphaerimonospora sp. CA-214678]|uniref:SDR family NAD(P)-dependent oxidoreductase n=1 Tax=Sphaerimonospora sp. CA-214678 TaxID=3240029 RepID=UPI003D8D44FF